MPKLKYHCVNRIPFSRGMGSSSAGIVAGLLSGLVLSGVSRAEKMYTKSHHNFLSTAGGRVERSVITITMLVNNKGGR